MKIESDPNCSEDRGIVLTPLASFRCPPVSVVRSFPFPSVPQDSVTQAQRRSERAAFPEFPEEPRIATELHELIPCFSVAVVRV